MPAAGFEIRIEGREALAKVFNELPVKIQRKVLRPALRAGAKVLRESVRRTAKSMLTKSDSPAPHVADTLKIKALKRDRSKRGRIGYIVITGKRDVLKIDGQGYYPAHIEYGYLAGPRTQGPTATGGAYINEYDPATGEWKRSRKNAGYVKGAREALAAGQRRHVAAVPFMKAGLEAGRSAATTAVADEMSRRMTDLHGLSEADAALSLDDDIGADESAEVF